MKKTALLLGATGLVGGKLLDQLLKDDRFGNIKTFGRSPVGLQHPKLEEHQTDLFKIENISEVFTGDVVFCCIGTTMAKTPDKVLYKKIDYGIPVATAKLAKANGIHIFWLFRHWEQIQIAVRSIIK